MKALLAVALLSMLALAGCAGSGPQTPAMDEEGRYVIHMTAGNRFSPANAKVPVGATVLWVNDVAVPHDVTADDGSWSSDDAFPSKMQKGDTYTQTFTTPGTVGYHCIIHLSTGMKATLVVEAPAA